MLNQLNQIDNSINKYQNNKIIKLLLRETDKQNNNFKNKENLL